MKSLSKDDQSKLFLLIALLLGGIVRFVPVIMAGFPVNDGGMFYNMVQELQANHFLLPAFTHYNLADIPYAYPPFGFYATALVSSLFHIPALTVVRWLPALVSTLSILAFYLMADEILGSRLQAALATIFYGLVPDSFGWAIMGGGITRSFGLLFLFMTIAFANRLFTRTSGLPVPPWVHAALTALFGALAFLSHPETGVAGCGSLYPAVALPWALQTDSALVNRCRPGRCGADSTLVGDGVGAARAGAFPIRVAKQR